jgi:hypothetical protein
MDSVRGTAALPAVGFPIRTSPDQSLVSGSPTLFAATHVLLRLLSPRHPSCALCSLVISLLAAPLPREDQGPARPSWLTEDLPDDTFLPTCAYAVFKDRKSWWSRSGSNRRHPACKAGALPAELRPREQRGGHDEPRSGDSCPLEAADDTWPSSAVSWCAWVDLNYRPHAYQACALTS